VVWQPTFLCLWVIDQRRDFGFWRAVLARCFSVGSGSVRLWRVFRMFLGAWACGAFDVSRPGYMPLSLDILAIFVAPSSARMFVGTYDSLQCSLSGGKSRTCVKLVRGQCFRIRSIYPCLSRVSMPIFPDIRWAPLVCSLLRLGCDCEVGRQASRVSPCLHLHFFFPSIFLKFVLGLLQLVFSALRRGVGRLRIGVSKWDGMGLKSPRCARRGHAGHRSLGIASSLAC
jgi:hypothetical protein